MYTAESVVYWYDSYTISCIDPTIFRVRSTWKHCQLRHDSVFNTSPVDDCTSPQTQSALLICRWIMMLHPAHTVCYLITNASCHAKVTWLASYTKPGLWKIILRYVVYILCIHRWLTKHFNSHTFSFLQKVVAIIVMHSTSSPCAMWS